MRYELFTRRQCPNCPAVKQYCETRFKDGEVIDCDTEAGLDLARARGVRSTPTAIFYDSHGNERARYHSISDLKAAMEMGLFWDFLSEEEQQDARRRARGDEDGA